MSGVKLETIRATLVGVAPLLMHNGRLANPTDPWTKRIKEVTSRKKKTDDDHLEIKRLEWFAGLYTDEKGKAIGLPSDVILATTIEGAKKNKNGTGAKAGIYCQKEFFPLEYDGPKDPSKLYEDERFSDYRGAKLQGRKVMRSRPRFPTWRLPIEITVDTGVMSEGDARQALEQAGALVGIGDWRPRYGRFLVEFQA